MCGERSVAPGDLGVICEICERVCLVCIEESEDCHLRPNILERGADQLPDAQRLDLEHPLLARFTLLAIGPR